MGGDNMSTITHGVIFWQILQITRLHSGEIIYLLKPRYYQSRGFRLEVYSLSLDEW